MGGGGGGGGGLKTGLKKTVGLLLLRKMRTVSGVITSSDSILITNI